MSTGNQRISFILTPKSQREKTFRNSISSAILLSLLVREPSWPPRGGVTYFRLNGEGLSYLCAGFLNSNQRTKINASTSSPDKSDIDETDSANGVIIQKNIYIYSIWFLCNGSHRKKKKNNKKKKTLNNHPSC